MPPHGRRITVTVLPRWACSLLILGDGAYLTLQGGTSPDFSGNVPYTITAWIYPTAEGDGCGIVTKWDVASVAAGSEIELVMNGTTIQSVRNTAGGPVSVSSPVDVQLDTWNSVATTYDGANLVVYVNGQASEPFAAPDAAVSASATELGVGAAASAPVTFNGSFARVQIWVGVALTVPQLFMESLQWTTQDDAGNYPYLLASFDFTRVPLIDQSGNGMTFGPWNGPQFVISAPVLDLTAAGAYVDCGNSAALSFPETAPYTVDGWLYLTAGTTTGVIAGRCLQGDGPAEGEWMIFVEDGVLYSWRSGPNGTTGTWVSNPGAPLQLGTWYHVATTYDGEALRVFVDGNLQAVGAMSSPITACPDVSVLVGAYNSPAGPANFFPGYLQNLRIWCVALDEAGIRQWMYNDPVDDPSLVAGLDIASMTLLDSTARNTLTLAGDAIVAVPAQVLDTDGVTVGWLQPTLGVSLQQFLEDVPVGTTGWRLPDMVPEELEWWISFASALTWGFLTKLFLIPAPGDLDERIYSMLTANTTTWSAVEGLAAGATPQSPIDLDQAIGVLQTVWTNELMWPILRVGMVSTGWLPLYLTFQSLGVVLSDPVLASTLPGLPLWIDELNTLMAQYPLALAPSGQ